jgi:transposase
MFSYFSPESRVPLDHPLRSIKAHTDRVLEELSGEIDALYFETGRPSIPPERLLKGQLLIALYSVLGSAVLPNARLQHHVSRLIDV